MTNRVYQFIESCVPLAIFEVTLANLDTRFQMSEFTQPMPGTPPKNWQVAYDEALLSKNGMQVLARNSGCTNGLLAGRVAFYFHYYDPSKPMMWTYGDFSSPGVQIVPKRLWDLVPYNTI